MCSGHCNGCEHSAEYCREHNPIEVKLCSACGELVNIDEGDECRSCGIWLCDSCANWTPKPWDAVKYTHLQSECRFCREDRESQEAEEATHAQSAA